MFLLRFTEIERESACVHKRVCAHGVFQMVRKDMSLAIVVEHITIFCCNGS